MADVAVDGGARTHPIDWSTAVWAGVIAGIVFMMMERCRDLVLPSSKTLRAAADGSRAWCRYARRCQWKVGTATSSMRRR